MNFTCTKCGEINEVVKEDVNIQFNEFWAAYPNKVGKGAAERSWVKYARNNPYLLENVLNALKWQRVSKKWLQGFIPNPATYLNQKRWLDEPEVEKPKNVPSIDDVMRSKGMAMDEWDRRYQEKYGKH